MSLVFGDYFLLFDELFEEVQVFFDYWLDEVCRLLIEVGYLDGFEFILQMCSCNLVYVDFVLFFVNYFEDVGVEMKI